MVRVTAAARVVGLMALVQQAQAPMFQQPSMSHGDDDELHCCHGRRLIYKLPSNLLAHAIYRSRLKMDLFLLFNHIRGLLLHVYRMSS